LAAGSGLRRGNDKLNIDLGKTRDGTHAVHTNNNLNVDLDKAIDNTHLIKNL